MIRDTDHLLLRKKRVANNRFDNPCRILHRKIASETRTERVRELRMDEILSKLPNYQSRLEGKRQVY